MPEHDEAEAVDAVIDLDETADMAVPAENVTEAAEAVAAEPVNDVPILDADPLEEPEDSQQVVFAKVRKSPVPPPRGRGQRSAGPSGSRGIGPSGPARKPRVAAAKTARPRTRKTTK